jgi:hypothetical protein
MKIYERSVRRFIFATVTLNHIITKITLNTTVAAVAFVIRLAT